MSDSRSVVLLDEVGTGTEPVEGAALGVALLEALVRGGRGGAGFVMATSHHRSVSDCRGETKQKNKNKQEKKNNYAMRCVKGGLGKTEGVPAF